MKVDLHKNVAEVEVQAGFSILFSDLKVMAENVKFAKQNIQDTWKGSCDMFNGPVALQTTAIGSN